MRPFALFIILMSKWGSVPIYQSVVLRAVVLLLLRHHATALRAMRFDFLNGVGAIHALAASRTFVICDVWHAVLLAAVRPRDRFADTTDAAASAVRAALEQDHGIHSARFDDTRK